jgi:hypothetical protein
MIFIEPLGNHEWDLKSNCDDICDRLNSNAISCKDLSFCQQEKPISTGSHSGSPRTTFESLAPDSLSDNDVDLLFKKVDNLEKLIHGLMNEIKSLRSIGYSFHP